MHRMEMTPQGAAFKLRNAGMTQTDIALVIGCNQSTVSHILRGRGTTFAIGQRLVRAAGMLGRKSRTQKRGPMA